MAGSDALPSATTVHRPPVEKAGTVRAFGPVIVADSRLVPALSGTRESGRRNAVALLCPPRRGSGAPAGEAFGAGPPGGGLLLNLADSGEFQDAARIDGLVLVFPRRVISTLLAGPLVSMALPRSAALDTLARLAEALLRLEAQLSEAQGRLAGRALTEMLTAVLLPFGMASGLVLRREATLLDRLVDHLDGYLTDPTDVAALCSALQCSRSALYRAAAPAGGVVALINQRRLAAVRDRLCDPAERASIAALARAHGFNDAAGFSHSFKRRYGVTAGQLRRSQIATGDRR